MFQVPRNHVAIYTLVDPRKPEVVRYVGKAANPRNRHLQHCAMLGPDTRSAWLEEMYREGVLPQMLVVDYAPTEQGQTKEFEWITKCASSGQLTNSRMGMRGVTFEAKFGVAASAEEVAKRKEALAKAFHEGKGTIAELPVALGITPQEFGSWVRWYGLPDFVDRAWFLTTRAKEKSVSMAKKAKEREAATSRLQDDANKYCQIEIFKKKPENIIKAAEIGKIHRLTFTHWMRKYDVPAGVHWTNGYDSHGNRLVEFTYDEGFNL